MERHEDHPTAPLRKRESSVAKCARGAQRAARIVRGQDCRERIVLVQRAAAGKPAARFRTLLTGWLPCALCLGLALAATGCGEILDAGESHGKLVDVDVDQRNPVIIDNDGWSDNWLGEYTVLSSNSGGPPLVGIVIGASKYWSDLDANVAGWTDFVTTARDSGLKNVPDVSAGTSGPLSVPADQQIDSTVPPRSAGAQKIVDLSRQLYSAGRPVVVLAGGALTNLADAYLMDHTVVDRVVVVADLGMYDEPKATMTGPNGDLDPWADWIVAQRFHYVQLSLPYEQAGDVTTDDFGNLPTNKLGDWMASKQPKLSKLDTAADQVTILAVGLPGFVAAVQQSAPDISAGFNSPPGQGPPLLPSDTGKAWVVTEIDTSVGRPWLWKMLQAPGTFGS